MSARRVYASLVNDRRLYPEYSWGWLNRLAMDLCWKCRGASIRPQYSWGTVFAAAQAKALGFESVSLLELGVAGGRGLLALQEIADAVSDRIPVTLHVSGFDTGCGLPEVKDIRDLPQIWKSGDFKMDLDALKSRLKPSTKLFVGPIAETIPKYLENAKAPLGFVSFDMDLYTSTRDALQLLFCGAAPLDGCLPRVVCYLDDIMGVSFSDLTGERLAMKEYNESSAPLRGICPIYGLRHDIGWPHNTALWPEMMFWAHFLDHPKYGICDGLVTCTQAHCESGR